MIVCVYQRYKNALVDVYGGEIMSDDKRKDIEEMVYILQDLDRESLLILNSGAQMLKARQDMEKGSEEIINEMKGA